MKKAIFISTLLVAASTSSSFAAEEGQQQQQAVPVQVAEVTSDKTTIIQNLPGRVMAVRTAEVRARVDGILEKRIFTEGQDVEKGQDFIRVCHLGN